MPASCAASLVSSFMLCAIAFDTTPVAEMVWPTWLARSTALLLLRASHVLPSLPVSTNSSAPSPLLKQPVTVLTSDFDLESLVSLWATAHDTVRPARMRHITRRLNLVVICFLLRVLYTDKLVAQN